MTAAFVLQFLAATLMTGIIWMVQIVHYPLFKNVGEGQFIRYQSRHTKLISYVVGPTMTVELVTALAVFKAGYLSGVDFALYVITFAILILIWLSTSLNLQTVLAGGLPAVHAGYFKSHFIVTFRYMTGGVPVSSTAMTVPSVWQHALGYVLF